MRKHVLLYSVLCILSGCNAVNQMDCSTNFIQGPKVAHANGMSTEDYILAEDFDTNSVACWEMMRTEAQDIADQVESGKVITIHYLDTTDFRPPAKGIYGSGAVSRRVIATHQRLTNGKDTFTVDPNGSGRYSEPSK